MDRRHFFSLAAAAPLLGAQSSPVHLIAHRGGVVDENRPENSRASIQAAIEQNYWMIEVDVWRTRDGHPVLQHDASFQRYYGDPRRVSEMTWDEIRRLRTKPGNLAPIDFEEMCATVSGKLRLMLDIKGDGHPDEFYAKIEDSLARHNLLRSAFTLGADRMKPRFWGKLWMSTNRQGLRAALARGEDVAKHYFLFELGSLIDAEALALAREHKVIPVAGINTFRYEMAKVDHWQVAEADIRRLLSLGVRHFQIDSLYSKFFPR